MQTIRLPRVARPIEFADYNPETAAALADPSAAGAAKRVWMWVNPNEAHKEKYRALMIRSEDLIRMLKENRDKSVKNMEEKKEPTADLPYKPDDLKAWLKEAEQQINAWWAETWSQNPDPATHWTPEDVEVLSTYCAENDPAFWEWLHRKCWDAVKEYRAQAKKT